MANSSNSKTSENGRFGLSSSGEFNAPYAYEGLLKLMALAVGAGFVALVIFVSIKVLRDVIASLPIGGVGDRRLFPAIVAAFVIFAAVVLALLFVGFTIKYVSTGFKCTYAANGEKMMLNYGKTEFIIFYRDVDLVEFSPRSFFNKINGYDVQIRINGQIQEFSIVSDSYISPKSTPFFIVKTQSEKIRIADVDVNDENRTQREIAMNIGSGRAISQAEIERARNKRTSVYDRLGELFDEDGDSVSNAESREYVSPYAGKVSPTAEGYSGDLPKATAMFERETHEIVLDNGRERDLYEIMKTGSFYVAPEKASVAVALIIWLFVGATIGFFVGFVVAFYMPYASILYLCCPPVFGALFLIHGLIHQRGREYKYRADGRSMKITSNRKPEENIIFDNVKSVNYVRKNLFGKPYAINVSIVTRYGTLNYRYLYPRFGKEIKESELPFAIIKDNIRNE